MKIYANGCSCVWGQELIDNNTNNLENMSMSFAAQIGAYNDSYPNSSNAGIINRTLDYCRRYKPDVCVIGFTEITRINISGHSRQKKDRLNQATLKPQSDSKYFLELHDNIDLLNIENKNIIEGLYFWLSQHNIKPVFFFSFSSIEVDVPCLWKGNTWLNQYAIENDLPKPKIRHPNQQEHNWIADYILEML